MLSNRSFAVRHQPICLVVALLLFLAPYGQAAESQTTGTGEVRQHVEQTQGYNDDHVYFAVGGAEVDAFNFNFLVSLNETVGFSMPVDGGLSHSLGRVYNSNFITSFTEYTHRSCTGETTGPSKYVNKATILPLQNPMGLGWEFHLGKIIKDRGPADPEEMENLLCAVAPEDLKELHLPDYWVYVKPDGSRHVLFKHDDDTSGYYHVYYTWDGSMIKAVNWTQASASDDPAWTVYLPGGRVLVMNKGDQVEGTEHDVFGGTTPFNPKDIDQDNADQPSEYDGPWLYERDKLGYYVSQIHLREVDGNGDPTSFIAVEYHSAPFDYIPATITDSHSTSAGSGVRQIDIAINDYDDTLSSFGHVTSITYPSAVDENGTRLSDAVFTFDYTTITLHSIGYKSETVYTGDPPVPATVVTTDDYDIDVLQQVSTPLGYATTYAYWENDPSYVPGGGEAFIYLGGRLKDIVYPSGKLVRLHYGTHDRFRWTNGGTTIAPHLRRWNIASA